MPITVKDLSHSYSPGTPFESRALEGISLHIDDGQFVGIVGPTGAGKSTLIQHFNGLLKPTSGTVIVDGQDLSSSRGDLRRVRQNVGVIFQYPEHQLFEETVSEDVGFGPRNLGLDADQIAARVAESMAMVGLDAGLASRSPFELSGGQMRRVAIAGVLAMKPRILVLDEPTAGLDPRGRDEILGHVARLHSEQGLTVVLVTHNMEDVARLTERVVVLHDGRLAMDGTTGWVFSQRDRLQSLGLAVPAAAEVIFSLRERGIDLPVGALTVEDAARIIVDAVKGRSPCSGT